MRERLADRRLGLVSNIHRRPNTPWWDVPMRAGGAVAPAVVEHTDADVVTVTQDDPGFGDGVAEADVAQSAATGLPATVDST